MNEVVLFSGLGANERVFQFLDLGPVHAVIIRWVQPHPRESLEDYAKRICEQIPFACPTLVGVSFGGMVAVEVSKHLPHQRVVLISSAPTYRQIPRYFRWAGKLRLHRLMPPRSAKKPGRLLHWMLGVRQPEHKNLMAAILTDTDPVFLARAVDMILRWRNEHVPATLYCVHGQHDRLLPKTNFAYDEVLDGGHLLIVTQAPTVSTRLRQLLITPPSFR
ncbi:MAG: alpha/beta hydrolase [Cyclobacteriaceae bacterium]|jgi:pimeloyl-ACP methyl ester carboxylesterase|nr:alpha/beta hydrolase [Cyclobacteriaceae bacterium]